MSVIPCRMPSPWRRLAAWGVDWLLIAAFLGGQFALHLLWGWGGKGQGFAFLAATLPVLLYGSLMEASARGATLGKRALGLRVVSLDGSRAPLWRTFLRTLGKFLPWEVAHTVYWHWPGWPLEAAPPTPGQVAAIGAVWLACAGYLVSLFLGSRRTPYDRLAGTRVEPAGQLA